MEALERTRSHAMVERPMQLGAFAVRPALLIIRAAFLVAALPTALLAQRATGQVSRGTPATPLGGAVVSVLDSSGNTTARALTDERGRYTVALTLRTKSLRIVHIGYRPVVLAAAPVAGETLNLDATMEALATILDAIRVQSDATCDASRDGRATLAL